MIALVAIAAAVVILALLPAAIRTLGYIAFGLFIIWALGHFAHAQATTPIHIGSAHVTGMNGAPVCSSPEMTQALCPIIPKGTSITVIAKGIPNIVYGGDMTPVEIQVPVAGSPPVIGWTYGMFLTN
jgi:hypothetical protein